MTKLLTLLGALGLVASAALGQQITNYTIVGMDSGATPPTASCQYPILYIKTSPKQLFLCDPITGLLKNIPVTLDSTGTIIVPAGVTFTAPGVTGTAATLAGTETLTNKTINNPVINGPIPVACGSTCTLGAANVGAYTRLDTAGGSAATLPAATGTGSTYKMYISVATSSAQDKVLLTTVTDTIIGTAVGENAGTAKVFVGNAGTYHSIQMPFAGSQPSGGFIGDTITCTDVASTIWKCDIAYQAGTTPTTPYNTGTT